jgi:hypothetical protein
MLEILLAAEESGEEGSFLFTAMLIGGVAFGVLLVLLIALLAFGKGREHS